MSVTLRCVDGVGDCAELDRVLTPRGTRGVAEGVGIPDSGEGVDASYTSVDPAPRFAVIAEFCDAAAAAVSVDGAALRIVGSTGGGVVVHSTDSMSFALDELQFGLAEGPCIDAVATNAPVFADALSAAAALGRWSAFARAATALGVGAEYTFPLLNAGTSVAVLQTYRREPGPLRPTHIKAIEALLASFGGRILDELAEHQSSDDGIAPEVRDRTQVHQAIGMVSVQLGLAVWDALARLRAEAFATDVPLVVLARDLINQPRRFRRDL